MRNSILPIALLTLHLAHFATTARVPLHATQKSLRQARATVSKRANRQAGLAGQRCGTNADCLGADGCFQGTDFSIIPCTPMSPSCVCISAAQDAISCSCEAPCIDDEICDGELEVCLPRLLGGSAMECGTLQPDAECMTNSDCGEGRVCRDGDRRCEQFTSVNCGCVVVEGGDECSCEDPCPLGEICARRAGRNICLPIAQNPSPLGCSPDIGPTAPDDPIPGLGESSVSDVPPLGGPAPGGMMPDVEADDGSLYTAELCSRRAQCAGRRRCVRLGESLACSAGEVCECVLENREDSRCSCRNLTCLEGDVCSIEGECMSGGLEPTLLECSPSGEGSATPSANNEVGGATISEGASATPIATTAPVGIESGTPTPIAEVVEGSVTPEDGDVEAQVGDEEETEVESGSGVCIDARRLEHLDGSELVFERDVVSKVLCDMAGSCATAGHMVHYRGEGMMMRSYCEVVGCDKRTMAVNSPKYRRGLRVESVTDGLYFTAFAARYASRVEESLMAAALRIGL